MAAPTFAVSRDDVRDAVVLALTGALDAFTAPDLDEAVGAALTPGHELVLDPRELEFLATGGVRALFRAAESAGRARVAPRILVGEAQHARLVIDRVDIDGRPPLAT
ncbi:STAS domain-containing protein [Dactylosporangium sp. NPDC000244]|uniref:STAS domain-containing protein n=1 Tax=Dactylosporangium sp. NPDC000244 TaxID=3154365 RepID=UPI00331C5E8B